MDGVNKKAVRPLSRATAAGHGLEGAQGVLFNGEFVVASLLENYFRSWTEAYFTKTALS